MIRLFTAVSIPEAIRQQLHGMGRSLPGARSVPEEQIHITLRFIGEVEGTLFKDIKDALSTVSVSPFSIAVQGVGHFPPRGKPRVIWAGLRPTDSLIKLKRRIDTCLIECGLPPDNRKFSPHVTLARLNNPPMKRITSFLAGNAFLQFDEFEVHHFHLYSSKLTNKGATHIQEADYPLDPDFS
jgi:RNA 2',3'-cyclic 3'-phosphodiesterase